MHGAARRMPEPSFRLSSLDFRRPGRRWRPEFVQRLRQQVDEARQLSLPLLYSRTLLLLSFVAPTSGSIHRVFGVADRTVGVVLVVFSLPNVMDHVLYSLAQVAER